MIFTYLHCAAGESSMNMSMIDSMGSFTNPNVVRKAKSEKFDPTAPNDHPILKVCPTSLSIILVYSCHFQLEGLKDSFRTIERAITQNIYHVKQAMYRNVDPIEGELQAQMGGNEKNYIQC